MKKVLFFIGCVLFFFSLLLFVGWTILGMTGYPNESVGHQKVGSFLNMNVYLTTVLFIVGTYLVSNNKPQE